MSTEKPHQLLDEVLKISGSMSANVVGKLMAITTFLSEVRLLEKCHVKALV